MAEDYNYWKEKSQILEADFKKTERQLSFWTGLAGWMIFICAILLIVIIIVAINASSPTIIPQGYTPDQCADIAIKIVKELR